MESIESIFIYSKGMPPILGFTSIVGLLQQFLQRLILTESGINLKSSNIVSYAGNPEQGCKNYAWLCCTYWNVFL